MHTPIGAGQSTEATTPRAVSRFHRRVLLASLLITTLAIAAGVGAWVGISHLEHHSRRVEALALVSQGEFAKAEEKLKALHETAPHDVEVLKALIAVLQSRGRLLVDAEPYLTKWCQLEPDNPEPFRHRMELYIGLEKRAEALADGRHILSLDPEDYATRRHVAALLTFTGDFAQAERACRQCLRIDPRDPDVRFLLAQTYDLWGKDRQAEQVLDALLQDHPRHPKALLLKSERLIRSTKGSDSERLAQTVAMLRMVEADLDAAQGDRQKARLLLSMTLRRLGKTTEAERFRHKRDLIERAEQMVRDAGQTGNDDLILQAAQLLQEAGDVQRAIEILQQLLERHPDNDQARALLVKIANN